MSCKINEYLIISNELEPYMLEDFLNDKRIIEYFERIYNEAFNIIDVFGADEEIGYLGEDERFLRAIVHENRGQTFCKKDFYLPPERSENRFNFKHINIMYLGSGVKTCLFEVEAKKGDKVSMAEFKILNGEQLKLLLLRSSVTYDKNNQQNSLELLSLKSKLLEKATGTSKSDYFFSQLFGEFCRRKGIDGIKYTSSMYTPKEHDDFEEEGDCVALFNFHKIKCVVIKKFLFIDMNSLEPLD